MKSEIQNKLRLMKLDLLSFLHTLSITSSVALDIEEISNSTGTAEANMGGIVGTLRRMKIDEDYIIIPAGRDFKGRLRWKINESVINKDELAKFLESEILGKENIKIKNN